PTVDGALWFARRVWPRVRREVAAARWLLAGARPAAALRRLAGRDGIELIAEPDDLEAIRRRARLAIAPLRAGSGVPVKVLEALAAGLPVIATPAAASGLDGLAGGELALAEEPADFAAAVVRLLRDGAAARAQATRAGAWLRAHHEPRLVASRFEAVLREALAGP
ncbi:MAG: glycosyltransferase, partial [Acidobacteria bacterium]